MIIGAHSIINSRDPDADRAFLKDVLGLPHVDAGGGWLIFGLPPAEVAVHPSDQDDVHELYLMTDDVEELVASMKARGIETMPISPQRWGMLTRVSLPGGGKLGIYQPLHPSPGAHEPRATSKRTAPAAKKRGSARKRRTAKRSRRSVR
jgi:hypothetical protein